MKCNECKQETKGTLLVEQYPQYPDDKAYFVAPLCDKLECRAAAQKKGARFV